MGPSKIASNFSFTVTAYVPAKAQLSLFGFNWSMTPLEALDTLTRGSRQIARRDK